MGQTKLIALTASSRVDYLRQVLASWQKVDGVSAYHFIARVEPSAQGIVEALSESELDVEIIVNERKMGPLTNPWLAIDDCMQRGAEFVVYAEDDVVVSNDVLSYMEWGTEEVAHNPKILTVQATQRWWTPTRRETMHTARAVPNFAANVWGVWSDRWYTILRDGWDHDYSKKGWDWWIGEDLIGQRGFLNLAPSHSRSQHIGKFGGAHMPPDQFELHLAATFRPRYRKHPFKVVA